MQPQRRLSNLTIILGLTLIAALPASAGSISLTWDPVQDAQGYRVYYGTTPGNYETFVEVGPTPTTTINGLDNCQTYFVAVKGFNSAGESPDFSPELSGWARPEILGAPVVARQGAQVTLQFNATNVMPGATLEIDNPHVVVDSFASNQCGVATAVLTIDPLTSGERPAEIGSFDVTIVNPDSVFGMRSDAFEVEIEPARFDVNRTDEVTRDRLDGKDTVWMARAFGVQEGEVQYQPDFDLDGDGWVDGQDLAYLASNLGGCWNGSNWSVAACPAELR